MINELDSIVTALDEVGCGDIIKIDFSVVNDMHYYNGIVLKGFVAGVPTGVLSSAVESIVNDIDNGDGFITEEEVRELFRK